MPNAQELLEASAREALNLLPAQVARKVRKVDLTEPLVRLRGRLATQERRGELARGSVDRAAAERDAKDVAYQRGRTAAHTAMTPALRKFIELRAALTTAQPGSVDVLGLLRTTLDSTEMRSFSTAAENLEADGRPSDEAIAFDPEVQAPISPEKAADLWRRGFRSQTAATVKQVDRLRASLTATLEKGQRASRAQSAVLKALTNGDYLAAYQPTLLYPISRPEGDTNPGLGIFPRTPHVYARTDVEQAASRMSQRVAGLSMGRGWDRAAAETRQLVDARTEVLERWTDDPRFADALALREQGQLPPLSDADLIDGVLRYQVAAGIGDDASHSFGKPATEVAGDQALLATISQALTIDSARTRSSRSFPAL